MRNRLIVALVALLGAGCTYELSLKGRSFQGAYEDHTKLDGERIAIARALLDQGRSDQEVLNALIEQGLSPAEARRILLLAWMSPPRQSGGKE